MHFQTFHQLSLKKYMNRHIRYHWLQQTRTNFRYLKMIFNNIRCRFQNKKIFENDDITHIRMNFIRIMSINFQRKWLRIIVENINLIIATQDANRFRFQNYIIDTIDFIDIHNDLNDLKIKNSSIHYQFLTNAIEIFEINELIMILLSQTSTSSNHSYIFNEIQNFNFFNQINLTNNVIKFEIALDTFIYAIIKFAIKLQKLSKFFSLYDHNSWYWFWAINRFKSTFFKRLKNIFAWIRVRSYRTFDVFDDITIFELICAIFAFLEIMNFDAFDFVAENIVAK